MIVHEVIGMENDPKFVLIFEEEVIIYLFCPIPPKEPVFIVALPGNVKIGVIVYDVVSRQVRHA